MNRDDRPVENASAGTGENPYAAPDTALPDLSTEAEIADAVAVHDRFPLLAKAVGTNFGLYARRWHLDDPAGGFARPWHWPALLFDVYWMLYRKMYLASLVFFGVGFIAGGLIAFLPAFKDVTSAAMMGLKLILCVSANQLYRWHCDRLIARQRAKHPDAPERVEAELSRRGGTSVLAVVLGVIIIGGINVLAQA